MERIQNYQKRILPIMLIAASFILILLFQNFTTTTPANWGNGHASSWDNRFTILTQGEPEVDYQAKWQICLFKPEQTIQINPSSGVDAFNRKVISVHDSYKNCIAMMSILTPKSVYGYIPKINADGSTDFVNYAHRSVIFSMNALAIAPVGEDPMANPFKSDLAGNASSSGTYYTYDFYLYTQIYHLSGRSNPETAGVQQYSFGAMRFKIVIENAFASNAMIKNIKLINDWRPIKSIDGQNILAIEPSVTADGRFMVMQDFGKGRIPGSLIYSYNATPSNLNGWTVPKNLSALYSDTGNINGIPLKSLYPIARKQIKSNLGAAYGSSETIRGAYPWISWEGSDLFFTATNSYNNAVRGGWSVVGESTGGQIRIIDAAFRNYADMFSDSSSTLVLFTSGIAHSSSIWNPYKELKSPSFPTNTEDPVGLFLHSNGGVATEVSFKSYVDGRYLNFLNMNNAIHKLHGESSADYNSQYDFGKTPDTSGNNFFGQLRGAAEIPRLTLAEASAQEFFGQFAQFKPQSSIEVVFDSLKMNTKTFSVEMMVKPTVNLENVSDSANKYMALVNIPGVMNLILEENRQMQLTLNSTTDFRTGFVGPRLPVGTWSHVAMTWNEITSLVQVYVNAEKVYEKVLTSGFKVSGPTGRIYIGPDWPIQGQSTSAVVVAIDEFKVSNVIRSSDEFADSAFIPKNQRGIPSISSTYTSIPIANLRVKNDGYSLSAAQLGSLIFRDPRLSSSAKISCASCHSAELGFSDGHALRTGLLGTKLSFNSPTLVNRVLGKNQTWDGKFTTAGEQLWLPLTHSNEMGLSVSGVVHFLNTNSKYKEKFQNVFGSSPNIKNIQMAVASFVNSIISSKSKFDRIQSTEPGVSFTPDELAGKNLFFGKARCAGCHSGFNFTDEQFHNTGIFTSGNFGLSSVTGRSEDTRKVKTPTLRHLNLTGPYFHDGSSTNLSEVIDRYISASVSGDLNKASEMKPLSLSTTEKNQLITFLGTLQSSITYAFNLNLTEPLPGLSLPSAPVMGTATAGPAQATVAFTKPLDDGGSAITSYEVYANGSTTAIKTGTSSPIVVTNLIPGTVYTFKVKAKNAIGLSAFSAASNSVIPVDPVIIPTISYSSTVLNLSHHQKMATLTPVRSGSPITNCTSSPSLPAGLSLDTTSCAISGMPTLISTMTTYKITAANSAGNSIPATVSIEVKKITELTFASGSLNLQPSQIVRASDFYLAFQSDGNLVVYMNSGKPLWATGTVLGISTNRLAAFQGDGNLVLYSGASAYWASHTVGSNYKLICRDRQPFLEIRNGSGQTVWSTAE